MATYVLSDIHGCYDELINVLEKISFSNEDELYVLGDLFDRGPKNAEVLKWFINADDNIHFLRGNHDDFMLDDTCMDYETLDLHNPQYWIYNHWDVTSQELLTKTTKEERKAAFDKIAESKYYERIIVNDNEFLLVHAGLNVGWEDIDSWEELMKYQSEYDMTWIREDWINSTGQLPCYVVFGHTATESIKKKHLYDNSVLDDEYFENKWNILKWNKKIAIDCGVWGGGRLGVLRLDDFAEFYSDFNIDTLNFIYKSGDDIPLFEWQHFIGKGQAFMNNDKALRSFELLTTYQPYIPEINEKYKDMIQWLVENPDNALSFQLLDEISYIERKLDKPVFTKEKMKTVNDVSQYFWAYSCTSTAKLFDSMSTRLQESTRTFLLEEKEKEQD